MVASLANPKLQLILVSEPIAMLPKPRRILLDAAGHLVSFETPPVCLLGLGHGASPRVIIG
jgi:hypothetical protein